MRRGLSPPPQHADEHRPKDPTLLAVDLELGEGSCGRRASSKIDDDICHRDPDDDEWSDARAALGQKESITTGESAANPSPGLRDQGIHAER